MKRTLLSTLVAGALAAGSMGSASAQPVFFFKGYGGWVVNSESTAPFPNPTYSGVNVLGNGTVMSDLSWGTPQTTNGLQSRARINDPTSLPGNAPGDYVQSSSITVSNNQPVLLGTLTHFNEPIQEWWEEGGDRSTGMNAGVATARVRYFFDVYTTAAMTTLIASLSSADFDDPDFEISFQETHNDGDCPAPNPNETNCDDIFSFDPAAASETFEYLGVTYRVTLSGFYDSVDLDNLTGDFYSGEGSNSIGFVGVVTHVPEPASVALMGLGLLGLGLARRRKHVKTA